MTYCLCIDIKDGDLIHFVKGKQSPSNVQGSNDHRSNIQTSGTSGMFSCTLVIHVKVFNIFFLSTDTASNFNFPMYPNSGFNMDNMEQMMNNPFVQSLMESPEFLEQMITSSPQIKRMVEQNPELGTVLKDPGTLKQVMDVMKNPNLMKEMIRSTDLAMQNIETHPEGFRILSRMFANPEDSIYNSSSSDIDEKSSTHDTAPEPNTQPLPNPWCKSPSKSNQSPQSPQSQSSPSTSSCGGFPFPFPNPSSQGTSPFSQQSTTGPTNPFNPYGLDMETVSSMMQNPQIQGMMNQMMSNPELMQSLMSNSPLFQGSMGGNNNTPPFGFNPMMMQNMFQPNMLQQNMFQQNSNNANNNTAPSNQAPPQEKFESQLQQLKDMGFYDEQKNLEALIATNGNVNAAVERLLSS